MVRAYFAFGVIKYMYNFRRPGLQYYTIEQFKAKVKVIMNHDMSAETSCTLYTGFRL